MTSDTDGCPRRNGDGRRKSSPDAALIDAAQAMAANQTSSGFAHGINQPLTAIEAYIDVCRARLGEPHGAHKALAVLDKMQAQSHRAADVVRALRDDLAAAAPNRRLLDVNDLVTRTADRLFAEDAADIALVLNPSGLSCYADPAQIQLALYCLIINAVEAVSTQPPEGREITVTTGIVGDAYAQISVADNGPGLSQQSERRLFEPLFTTKPGHAGLGLAQCDSIARSHGGQLRARDRPGGGAVLRLILPRTSGP